MKGTRLAAAVAAIILTPGTTMSADIEAGKKAFAKCKACHTLEAGKNRVGPTLHGVFGRKAGTLDGFKFSKAMKDSGITWDDEAMRRYLENPKAVVPNGRMAFAGIKQGTEMDNLMAYLKEATK